MNTSYLGNFTISWICNIKCLRGSFMPPSVTVWHLRNIWQRGLCHSRRWWRESGFSRSANTQACSGRATWPAQSLYLPPCHLLLTGHHQSSLDQGHSGTPPPSCAAFQNTNRRRSRKCFVIPMNGELDKGGRAHAWEEIKAQGWLQSQPSSCLQAEHLDGGSDQSEVDLNSNK